MAAFGSRLHFKRCQPLPKGSPFPFFRGPLFLGPLVFFFFCFFSALQRLARLKCNLEPNCKHLGVSILQPHAFTQRDRLRRILCRTRSNAGRTSVRSLSGRISAIWETPLKRALDMRRNLASGCILSDVNLCQRKPLFLLDPAHLKQKRFRQVRRQPNTQAPSGVDNVSAQRLRTYSCTGRERNASTRKNAASVVQHQASSTPSWSVTSAHRICLARLRVSNCTQHVSACATTKTDNCACGVRNGYGHTCWHFSWRNTTPAT